MHAQRLLARLGAILSLLGGALVLSGVGFLPMVIGNGGGSVTPHAEWEVATFCFQYLCGPASLVVAFPVLLMLVVVGPSSTFLRGSRPNSTQVFQQRAQRESQLGHLPTMLLYRSYTGQMANGRPQSRE